MAYEIPFVTAPTPAAPDPTLTWGGATYSPSANYAEVTVASIPNGAVVVAFAGQGEGTSGALTVSSSNLSWTQRATVNGSSTKASIWTAVAGSSLTNEAIRNTTSSGSGYVVSVAVWVITNAAATFTQVATNSGSTAAFSAIPSASGSAIYVGGSVIYVSSLASPSAGNSEDYDQNDAGGYGVWCGHRTDIETGSQSVGGTWVTGAAWAAAAIAINGSA